MLPPGVDLLRPGGEVVGQGRGRPQVVLSHGLDEEGVVLLEAVEVRPGKCLDKLRLLSGLIRVVSVRSVSVSVET